MDIKADQTRRVQSACTNCRKTHSSCHPQRPCWRCVAKDQAHSCYDAPPKKRGRPPSRKSPPYQSKFDIRDPPQLPSLAPKQSMPPLGASNPSSLLPPASMVYPYSPNAYPFPSPRYPHSASPTSTSRHNSSYDAPMLASIAPSNSHLYHEPPIVYADASSETVISTNSALESAFGISGFSIAGKPVLDIFAPSEWPRVQSILSVIRQNQIQYQTVHPSNLASSLYQYPSQTFWCHAYNSTLQHYSISFRLGQSDGRFYCALWFYPVTSNTML